MSNATAKIDLNITEGMIQNAIAVAIADAFSPEKKDQVLRDIVRAHLSHKQNSYDRDTMLSKTIGDQIRTMATEAVKHKIAGMADDIRATVDKALGPQFSESVLSQLELSLARVMVSGIVIRADAVGDNS
jgi:hypothetical protein